MSSVRFDASSQTVSWQGWAVDGAPLGQLENLSTSNLPPPAGTGLAAWLTQQESLEVQIGLSFPPEFNLIPR
jgi:hypothetical protein